ncbi:hypothetical protein GTQ43_36035 [Nostoc sp. KVJ3]|uniref:PD-(D/E)XK nuclease family protein n=1 Tax=Nostoc sp. KVJ3 TaxID=457945 RepID=UPI00223728D6|nr:PD-(D/E)XK nuclease family protein [Nostoc sp. KVJ3]MCW5318867.1 hypothetical protein [Nostoc sp. KVJ3]
MKWSISTHNCFRRCPRQYFFSNIMAFHNAKDPLRREAFMLRQLKSIDEWRGSLVHSAIELYLIKSLEGGILISEKELLDKTITLAKAQFEFSHHQRYKDPNLKKKDAGSNFLALRDHEHGIPIPQEKIDSLYKDIKQCYEFIYSNTRFIKFLQGADDYFPEKSIYFKFNGSNLSAQLDLAVPYSQNNSNKLCIIDWKISRVQTSDYSKQLYFYGFAALKDRQWRNYKAEDLLLVEANLLQGKFVKYTVSAENLLQIEDFIYRSLLDIQFLTGERKYNLDDLEDYEYANSPMSCEYCKFERMCVRFAQ